MFQLKTDIDSWPAGMYNAGWISLESNNEKYGVMIDLKIKRKDKHIARIHEGDYREINLKQKLFTSIEEGCTVLEVSLNGTRVRKIQNIN